MNDSVSSESASLSSGAPAASEPARVGPQSFLTLHYRLSLPENGADVINTFEGKPATLQLGIGQMSEVLENCLVGMADGEHRIFELAPGEAFGQRMPDDAGTYQPGDLVEFPAPDGSRFAGVLKEQDETGALFDFNHPLAGKAVRFEVKLLGVL